MSSTDLRTYVGATTTADEALVQSCWDEAEALVVAYIGSATGMITSSTVITTDTVITAGVPATVYRRAVLEVGAELFHRRQAPGGITQFATVDGSAPVRMARDPLVAAYPILDRYLPGALA